jgi:putative tricarboxylic transport membrane protein
VQRVHQVISLVFLALGLYVVMESIRLVYMLPMGPGPGFFPFWLGALIAALAAVWFVRTTIRPPEPAEESFLPRGTAARRILSVLAATALMPALGEHLGFRLTMLACLLFLLGVAGRQKPLVTIPISLIGSFGVYFVFHDLLDVYLPTARFSPLLELGL